MKFFSAVLIIGLSLKHVDSQSTCNSHTSCGECVGFADDRCVWCSEPDSTKKHCQSEAYSKKNKLWCEEKFIFKGKQGDLTVTLDDNKMQFRPQVIDINMLPGEIMNFNISYKPAKDYPLDVYYLMDHSYTMKQHIKVLQKQGRGLYIELTKYTNNVHFGVGSFVDKPALPYADPIFTYAYSFKHHLSMTENIGAFEKALTNTTFGSNYDDPEAGLDALMQVMKCEKELGWRTGARRIIILCTDATYHSAGDGKMLGAFKPNDMKCHLDHQIYEPQLVFDYPSVSQINKVAHDNKFQIIFAVVKTVEDEYLALAKAIPTAQYAELKQESNIVSIIKKVYADSVQYLQVNSEWPSNIQLILEPDCTKKKVCKVQHNKSLEIKASLRVKSCLKPVKLKIEPVGLHESLTVNLNVNCKCECENSGEKNSKRCSSSGTSQCGICKCNAGSYGNICQCSGTSEPTQDLEKCKANINDTYVCSGRGSCKCGECESCNKGFSGQFCEFDDNACPRVNNIMCAGRGKCHFGRCKCNAHWTGESCKCPDHNLDCVAPYSKDICSGNGKCVCGECICDKVDSKNERYGGTFCDVCDECAIKRCKELEDYAYCNYLNNKTYCDDIYKEHSTEVFKLNATEIKLARYVGESCEKIMENGTILFFKHNYDNSTKTLNLFIQTELKVPEKANIWVAAGSAICAVLLIGLLTLIAWKILADLHDKKEYEKFAIEAQAEGYNVSENPWYRPPECVFSNPTFNQ